jgi:hypothetical protein
MQKRMEDPGKEMRKSPRSSGRQGQHKSRKRNLKKISQWIKKNPLKIAALFFIGAIIYVSVLFYNYEEDQIITNDSIYNDKMVKGILVPMRILSELSAISIQLGTIKSSVSLQELKKGYKVSPANMINCGSTTLSDPSAFIITLIQERLYVTASFKHIFNEKIIGSVNNAEWSFLSENITDIRTDDYSFEVLDNTGNVIFNMQFAEPDILSVNGYFIGAECIYVISDNSIYSNLKTGNYIERALPEIKRIKKIW